MIPEADYGKKKNNGGLIGGIGYVGEKVGTGLVSVFEGLADYTVGGISKLFGADEFAEYVFDNDWINYNHADEWYNPSDGWKIAGDVGSGIGTSLPTIAAAVGMTVATGGTAAPVAAKLLVAGTSFTITGVSAAGNATKEAYRSTGKLGGKEFGYGALSGATEGTIEAVSDLLTFGTGKIVTKLGKKAAGDIAETVVRKTAKQVAWDAAKNIGSDFISEGVEEMVSEYLDPKYARATYDPNAEDASIEQILYSGLVGGLSGVIMGGTSRQINSASNFISGHKAVKNGTVGAIMNNASKIAEYEAKEASGSKLYKSIKDTYNDLSESLKATGGVAKTQQQKVQLGQLKQMVTSVPFSIEAERSVAKILNDPKKFADELTSYGYTDASGNKLTFTAEELMQGIDMSATGKERAKQIRKVLSDPNSKLAAFAISDAVGHVMMDTRRFAEATMKGEHLANTATLNEFIQNATPSEKAALGADLGISDWSTATITDINNGLTNFYGSGKASEVLAQRKRIDLAKKVENTKPQNLPHRFQKNMKDGVYRLSDPNGSADIAMIKVESSYSVYDFSTGGISRTLTAKEANALLKKYWENQNSDTLAGETRHKGVESVTGADVKEFANKHIPEYKNLSVPNKRAVEMTVRQALANGLNAEDTALLGRIAASTGVNIIFDSQKSGGRAMFDPDTRTIYLHPKLESGDMYVYLLGHELKHAVFDADTTTDKNGNKVRGKLGNRLISEAYKRIDPEDYKKTRDKYAEHYRQKNLLFSVYKPIIEEEIAAKYSEKVFRSKKAWDYILSEDPSKAENVLDFFKRAVRKYSDLSGVEKTSRKFLNTYKRMFDNLQSTNARNNDIALNMDRDSNDIRYALRDGAAEEVAKVLSDIDYREDVFLTESSPSIIASQNGVKNLPMLMKASHIRENVLTEQEATQRGLKVDEHTHYHGLGEDLFLQIIDGLDDVTLAYRGTNRALDSSRRENYFLLISQIKDANGNAVNVPVYINEIGQYNRVFIETNKIATVFGRNDFFEYIQRKIQSGDLVRIKNKSIQTSERAALIADGYSKNASADSIHQSTEKVNSNSKNNSDINKRHALPDTEDNESSHISSENLEKFNSFAHSVKLTKGQTYDIQNKVKEIYEDKKKRTAKMTSIKSWIASSDDQIDTSIPLNQFIKNISGMDEKLNRLSDMDPSDAFIEFDKLYRQSIMSFNKQQGIKSKSEEKTQKKTGAPKKTGKTAKADKKAETGNKTTKTENKTAKTENESSQDPNASQKNKGPINAVTEVLNEFHLDFTSTDNLNEYGDPVIAKGKIKSIRQVSDFIEQKIKLAPQDKRSQAFVEVADYIIKNITVKADYGTAPDSATAYHDTLKSYHHKFNLSSIKDEINYLGADKARTMNLLWGNKESALTPDMIKDELYEKGIYINADNPADIFLEIVDRYELANKELEKFGVKTLSAEKYLSKNEMNALKRNVLRLLAQCIDNSKSDELYVQLQNLRLHDQAKLKEKYEKRIGKQKEEYTSEKNKYYSKLKEQKECVIATNAIARYITRLKDRGAFERATGKLSDPAWKSLFGLTKGMVKNSSIVLEKAHNFTTGYLEFLQKQAPELFSYSEAMASDVENKEAIYDTFVKSRETNEISSIVDPYMVATLIKIKGRVSPDSENKYPKLTLDSKELKAIGKAIASMTTLENRVDKTFYNGKWENVEKLSTQALDEAFYSRNGAAPVMETNNIGAFLKKGVIETLQPGHVIRLVSGGVGTDKTTVLENMAHEITLSEARAEKRCHGYLDEVLGHLLHGTEIDREGNVVKLKGEKREKWKKWAKGLDTRTLKLNLTRIGFDGKADSRSVPLTVYEAIQLIMLSKDADARDALNLGRIEFADGVRNGAEWHNRKLEGYCVDDLKATDEEIKKIYIKNNVEVEAAIKNLESQLEEYDLALMKTLEKFYNGTSKNDKRATDIRTLGKSNVKNGYYVPISRSGYYRDANLESENTTRFNNGGVNNMTFNKHRVEGAKAGICVKDAVSVFNKHASELATYVEMTDALRTFRKVYNAKSTTPRNGISTTREYIARYSWSGFENYIKKVYEDVQHRTVLKNDALSEALRFLKKGYVKYMLALNRGSVYKQVSTLAMMTSKVSPAAWFYGMNYKTMKQADEYSVMAANRNSNEALFAAAGAMGKIDAVTNVLMKPFAFGDRAVTLSMWSMCQKEIEITKGLKVGTEGNLTEAGKLLDECILEFQDTSGVMTKSALARSTNELGSALAMFRSATNKMFSGVYMAVAEISEMRRLSKIHGAPPKELKKKLAKHLTKLLAAIIGVSLIESAISEMVRSHNKGNDKNAGGIIKSIGKNGMLNIVGLAPVVGQITESLFSEYDPSLWILDMVKDLRNATRSIGGLTIKLGGKEEIHQQDVLLPVKDTVRLAGEILGIPTRNISNLTNAVLRRFSPSTAYKYNTLFYDPKVEDIKKAYARGDERTAQMATALIMREMKTGSSPDKLVTDEMTRLYAKGLITLPKSTPDEVKINGEAVKLKSPAKQRFKEYYQKADEAALSIVKGSAYRSMTDEQKANALRYCYDIGYDLAKYSSFGIDPNKRTVTAKVIGIEKLSLAYALTKGLASDKNSAGKTITNSRKKKVLATIKGLGLIPGEVALLLNTLGYSIDHKDIANLSIMRVKRLLRKRLLESGLKNDELSVVADMCGFELSGNDLVL